MINNRYSTKIDSGRKTPLVKCCKGLRIISSGIGFVLLTAAAFYLIYRHFTAPVIPFDDAHITFRYVRNLFNGTGLVYNSGEYVFGISSPLYLGWLILIKSVLPVSIPILAVRGNLLFMLVCAGLLFIIIREMGYSYTYSFIAISFFMIHRDMIDFSMGGMESFLFAALILGSLWAFSRQRFFTASLFLGLSALARPEGMTFIFPILFILIIQLIFSNKLNKKQSIVCSALMLIPVTLWCIFAFIYYGNCVPHSLIAKFQPLYPLAPGKALSYIISSIEDWTISPIYILLTRKVSFMTIALLFFGLIGSIFPFSLKRSGTLIGSGFLLLTGSYVIGNPMMMQWYLPPIYVLWFLLITTGIPNLVNLLKYLPDTMFTLCKPYRSHVKTFLSITVLLFLLFPLHRSYQKPPKGFQPAYPSDAQRLRTGGYKMAAEWLNEHAASSTVASPEIGALGYYYQGFIYDACGLVTPEALPHLPVPENQRLSPSLGSISVGFVETVRAKYVVTLKCFAEKSLFASEVFQSKYYPVKIIELPKPVWKGSDRVTIFKRNDLPN